MESHYSTFPQQVKESQTSKSALSLQEDGEGSWTSFVIAWRVLLVCGLVMVASIAATGQLLTMSSSANIVTSSASLSTATTSATSVNSDATTAINKPNFVFVLIDDLGWNSIGFQDMGWKQFTPHMTQLAEQGIFMTNYYAQELCSPSRSALLTGKYPSSIGMQNAQIQITTDFGLSTDQLLLQEALKNYGNYSTYMVGKWDLGHSRTEWLPTARGFDEFLGFMGGADTYWSKHSSPVVSYDLMAADTHCYSRYDEEDWQTYATTLYEDKAVTAIREHDYDSNPMFLYFSSQAVHNPFGDPFLEEFREGVTADICGQEIVDYAAKNIVGSVRQQLFLSLYLLDQSVGKIVTALQEVNQLDNTYIIVSSDNGGCYINGGRGGPLRGTKASLWEGGVKVDAFLYSPLIPKGQRNKKYGGLMHITDWYPTIMELSDTQIPINVLPQWDGVSHTHNFVAAAAVDVESPRKNLLYNVYTRVADAPYEYNISINANAAVRNERYKLLHVYTHNDYDKMYSADLAMDIGDTISSETDCGIRYAMLGDFSYLLFDLQNDPFEERNLYGQSEVAEVQQELTALLYHYADKAQWQPASDWGSNQETVDLWTVEHSTVQPWVFPTDANTAVATVAPAVKVNPATSAVGEGIRAKLVSAELRYCQKKFLFSKR